MARRSASFHATGPVTATPVVAGRVFARCAPRTRLRSASQACRPTPDSLVRRRLPVVGQGHGLDCAALRRLRHSGRQGRGPRSRSLADACAARAGARRLASAARDGTRRLDLAAAASLVAACGHGGSAEPATSGPAAVVVAQRQVAPRELDLTVRSAALGRAARVRLLTPVGWTPSAQRRWPVLYLLHGCCDSTAAGRGRPTSHSCRSCVPCWWSCLRVVTSGFIQTGATGRAGRTSTCVSCRRCWLTAMALGRGARSRGFRWAGWAPSTTPRAGRGCSGRRRRSPASCTPRCARFLARTVLKLHRRPACGVGRSGCRARHLAPP